MIPLIYGPKATDFTTLGIGSIPDALECIVHEVRNGANALELDMPISSEHIDDVKPGNIIVVDTNPSLKRQAYDIYNVEKKLDGRVTVLANHISYRLRYSVLKTFSAASASEAMTKLSTHDGTVYIDGNDFNFNTDVTTAGSVNFTGYNAVRDVLGGTEGSILDVYGGFYLWDNFTVSLLTRRGQDNGVRILYGKNLQNLTDETDDSDVINGVWPIYTESGVVTVTGNSIITAGDRTAYKYGRTVVVDFSDRFDSTPTSNQLDTAAAAWLNGKQDVRRTLSAAFIPLYQTIEYKDLAMVEPVNMDDTIYLHVPEPFNIDASARVVETYYDVLKERYDRIEIGSIRPTLADAIRAL